MSILCAPKLTYSHFLCAYPLLFRSCKIPLITHNRVHASQIVHRWRSCLLHYIVSVRLPAEVIRRIPALSRVCLGICRVALLLSLLSKLQGTTSRSEAALFWRCVSQWVMWSCDALSRHHPSARTAWCVGNLISPQSPLRNKDREQ